MIDDISSMMYVKYNIKLDFVTIIFHNKTEYELLKLQAYSFYFVDSTLINRIIIIFNDVYKDIFNNYFFKEVYPYYPEHLKPLVEIVYANKIIKIEGSNWFSQQAIKIAIAKKIKTKYYVVLDAKNHFIKNIQFSYFFGIHKLPILYYNQMSNEEMITYYKNCLNYFNVSNLPSNYLSNNPNDLTQTITPYIFITQECKDLMEYVEKREKTTFCDFFLESKKYTEFYLYYAYLLFKRKHTLYEFKTYQIPVLTIGPENPAEYIFNRWEHKAEILENYEIQVMALHRYSIYVLDDEYKEHLRQFYQNIYGERGVQLLEHFFSFNLLF